MCWKLWVGKYQEGGVRYVRGSWARDDRVIGHFQSAADLGVETYTAQDYSFLLENCPYSFCDLLGIQQLSFCLSSLRFPLLLLVAATFGPDPKSVIDCRMSQAEKIWGGLSPNFLLKAQSTLNVESLSLSQLMERSSLKITLKIFGITPFVIFFYKSSALTALPLSNLSSF